MTIFTHSKTRPRRGGNRNGVRTHGGRISMHAHASLQAAPDHNLNPSAKVIDFPKRGGGRRTTKGRTFPPDPITADDVALLLDTLEPRGPQGVHKLTAARLRALIAVLYRSGVRINEALEFVDSDLHRADNVLLVRHGKGDKRRIVVMDDWGWRELERWLVIRESIPAGFVFPTLRDNPGGKWADCDVRRQLHELGREAGLRKRIAPHQFRHGHAVELWREGFDAYTIQKQLGHANLNVTTRYLSGVDPLQVLAPIGERKAPKVVIA